MCKISQAMFVNRATLFLLVIVITIKNISSANILYVAPIPSPSHHIWNKALTFGLLEKGHNVTMISHDTEKIQLPENFTLITMEGIYEKLYEAFDIDEFSEKGVLSIIHEMYEYSRFSCEYDYNTKGFETLLNYPKDYKFDIIIFDASIASRCYYPLIEKFQNPPAVIVTPFLLPPVLSTVFGNHLYTSYMPYFGFQYTNQMDLLQRIMNFILTNVDLLYRNYIILPKEDELIKQRFPNQKFSPEELERNISLLLSNVDPILDYPVALPPNIIPVGGLHARTSRALPKDLQNIMDQAKQGVILFSLGSNIRSDKLNLETRKALLDAFAKLPEIVLWKFETDNIEGLPNNVIIRKWLPQNDILGHSNIKLFISHGGALSTQEAMYHGVPVIGIPYFGDQHVNIRKMEEKKIAKCLDKKQLTFDNIYKTLKEVLDSTIYRDNMRALSRRYHDQPQTSLDRGVFWIEYVLRHSSAEHLNIPARDMPTYQTANLDVLAVFALTLILLYSLILFALTCCRFVMSMRHYSAKSKISK